MPRYAYYCESCEETFEQFHSMTVVLDDCHLCGSQETLQKIMSGVRLIDQKVELHGTKKPGQIVKQHIEEAKQDIKQEKEIMMQEYE
jgi:putative FmdB family regulatory protein